MSYAESDFTCDFQGDACSCANDEARSMFIDHALALTKFKLYDSPDGSQDDDYTEITVLKDIVEPYLIPSFEYSFEDEYVEAVHVHQNGLDGKVSRLEVVIF